MSEKGGCEGISCFLQSSSIKPTTSRPQSQACTKGRRGGERHAAVLRKSTRALRWLSWKHLPRTSREWPWWGGTYFHRSCLRSCSFWTASPRPGRTCPGWPGGVSPHPLWGSYTLNMRGQRNFVRWWSHQMAPCFYDWLCIESCHLQNDALIDEGRLLLGTTEHVDHIFHGHLATILLEKIIIFITAYFIK